MNAHALVAFGAIALFLVACGVPSAESPASVAAATPVADNVTGPAGVALGSACVPSGPELCFNAIDDNCNGVIDEGCGEQTGVIQLTIAWGASPADVNLAIVLPGGERVPDGKTHAAEGFTLDRDCPSSDRCRGQNVENLSFEGTNPAPGHYAVEVSVADLHGAQTPVPVRFGARLWRRVVGFDVQVSPGAATQVLSFDVK